MRLATGRRRAGSCRFPARNLQWGIHVHRRFPAGSITARSPRRARRFDRAGIACDYGRRRGAVVPPGGAPRPAEIHCPDYVSQDRRQRTLGMRAAAEAALTVLPAEVRGHLDAYAAGVNAYLASRRDRLPVEFRVLRYAPRSWTPVDSMLIGLN